MPRPEITRRPRFRAEPPYLNLTSSAFADGARLPRLYTADGENVSPPLTWGEPPAGTATFALVCDDPDSQSGGFVHWVVWNMKADRRALEENVPKVATELTHVRQRRPSVVRGRIDLVTLQGSRARARGMIGRCPCESDPRSLPISRA